MAIERTFKIYADESDAKHASRRIDIEIDADRDGREGVRLVVTELDRPSALPESEASTAVLLSHQEAKELAECLASLIDEISAPA